MKDLYFAYLIPNPLLAGSPETDFFCSEKKRRCLSCLREVRLFLLVSLLILFLYVVLVPPQLNQIP